MDLLALSAVNQSAGSNEVRLAGPNANNKYIVQPGLDAKFELPIRYTAKAEIFENIFGTISKIEVSARDDSGELIMRTQGAARVRGAPKALAPAI